MGPATSWAQQRGPAAAALFPCSSSSGGGDGGVPVGAAAATRGPAPMSSAAEGRLLPALCGYHSSLRGLLRRRTGHKRGPWRRHGSENERRCERRHNADR